MMRVLIVPVVFAMALAGPAFAADAKIEQGPKVFAAQKCSLCHSIANKGNKKGPLDDVGSKLKPEEIRKWITAPQTMKSSTDRKPPMKAFANLPAADLDALVTYLSSLKK